MMRRRLAVMAFMAACTTGMAQRPPQTTGYNRYVNPFIGTGAVDKNSLSGSNFPGACTPFGLVQLGPDTRDNPNDPASGYDYNDTTIVGFSHTHLSGTGVADLFDFLFMPYTGDITWNATPENGHKGFRSAFTHEQEKAVPGYYSVQLLAHKTLAELTATAHCGVHRYTFPQQEQGRVMVDLDHSLDKKRPYWECKVISAHLEVVNDHTIEGYRVITGWSRLRKVYFRAVFSKPFAARQLREGGQVINNGEVANGRSVKGVFSFAPSNAPLLVKVGISAVSAEGARSNLAAEVKDFDFDATAQAAANSWSKELGVMDAEGTDEQKTILYTGLYHLFTQPNNLADADSSYAGTDYTVRKAADGAHYSTFSLWDTYRAAHPLYTLVQQGRTAGFINSMIRQYETYGYLPVWQLWGDETYCMIGNHAIPVIADAYRKGIAGIDYAKAYEAAKASSLRNHPGSPFHLLEQYKYFPEDKQSQSVSLTLEIAYDDWCVAQMALQMGKKEDYQFFLNRSTYYRNLYDQQTGFFRGKNSQGEWLPFNPLTYGGNGGSPFTEGNGWQYFWYVPQDVPDLIKLVGGDKAFVNKLDTFFTHNAKPEDVNGNASGFIGQYAHGNEPSHHVIYLYNYAGEPWKAQQYAAQVMQQQYNGKSSGYSGNEDCGQMSAWYIFSAMGFYPVNPANGIYALGSPQLSKAVIKGLNGKNFTVVAEGAGGKNCYIQRVTLNGKPYNKTYITHSDIVNGGTLVFTMGEKPNKKWGVAADSRPPLEEVR